MKSICPICQQKNNCELNNLPCWCMSETLKKKTMQLIKDLTLPSSCICKDCLQQLSSK